MTQPTLSTINQFADKQPAFTSASLQKLISNEATNGLTKAGAIVRVGRRVLINEEKFFSWIEAGAK